MDIYLSGKNSKNKTVKLRIPVLPESINLNTAGSYREYDILNLGPTKVASGTELEELEFSSFFPGKQLKEFGFMRGAWQKPSTYDNMLTYWRKNGTDVKVLVSGTSINMTMRIEQYDSEFKGAFGDVYYTLKFFLARNPVITSTTVKKKKTSTKTSGTARSTKKTKTYTIKKGDCLWNIAKKYYGSGAKWTTIYKANKSVIEARAKKAGKKSSNNGNLIYPGTKLTIP